MREIVLDTETTGTDPNGGDRVIEIGCVELLNKFPTGRSYHVYLNPQRAVSAGALAVHGLSDAFLADKPLFSEVADAFYEFIAQGRLVIHNAAFDVAFLNAEFARTGHASIPLNEVVDTLTMARRKHPGASNSLDALCSRYGIDNSRRTKHGALLDAEILAEVYIELIGGKQADLGLSPQPGMAARSPVPGFTPATPASRSPAIIPPLTGAEQSAHAQLVLDLGTNAVWKNYIAEADPEIAA